MSALLLFLALATPPPALGQGREVNATVGYQRLRISDADANGFFADAAVSVAGPLAVVGAIDWTHRDTQEFGFEQSTTSLAASGGARLLIGTRRLAPFGHVLVGVERNTLEVARFGSDTATHLLVQPGGGIALRVSSKLRVVGQVDWHHVDRDEDANGLRLVVGARLRLR
jgi:hypothetical protein